MAARASTPVPTALRYERAQSLWPTWKRARSCGFQSTRQGAPGAAEVWVKHPDLVGADGIAFGLDGELYVANVLKSTLIRIDGASKAVEILATAADGLDNPASLAIGSRESGETTLYITNYPVIAPDTAPPGVLGTAAGWRLSAAPFRLG